jgi:hypothetical protein
MRLKRKHKPIWTRREKLREKRRIERKRIRRAIAWRKMYGRKKLRIKWITVSMTWSQREVSLTKQPRRPHIYQLHLGCHSDYYDCVVYQPFC